MSASRIVVTCPNSLPTTSETAAVIKVVSPCPCPLSSGSLFCSSFPSPHPASAGLLRSAEDSQDR